VKPHKGHRRGTVVDVRANGTTGSIPIIRLAKFMEMLDGEEGIDYIYEDQVIGNEHFHIEFSGHQE
jgi:hypothetical protein